jgi:restriction endonuclease S subunit
MKCFAVNFNNLKGVLSPLFFLSTPQNTSGYIALKKVAKINPKRTIGSLTMDTNVPYIGLPETDDKEVKRVLTRPYIEVVGRNIIRDGDVLFSRIEPSIFNKKYIYAKLKTYDYAFASTEFYVVEPSEDIHPKFLFYMFFFDAVYNQILGKTTGSTGRRRLDKGVFENIFIPYPPREKQVKIAELLDFAHGRRRQKETKAQELLDSIDGYVLGELGINIDYKSKLTFATYSNQVKGRLDSLYHCQDVYYFLSDYKGNKTKLGDCVEYAQSGFAAGYANQGTEGDGILQIRPTNISDDRRLIFDRNIYVKQEAVEKQPGDILVKGEVLFNNTNSQELVGKSVVFNLDGHYFCSNHITRIKVKESALVNDYLAAILNLYQRRGVFYRICTNWNNQSGVNIELLKTVRIPLPTSEVQRGISSEIRSRMSQADKLRQQAKVEFEKAKAEVERLILGG